MLTHVVGRHWPAVVRDVLALGYRVSDIFSTLTLEELLAVVIAAPPSSSVRTALDAGWSREAHLLANMQEQRAGLTDLSEPYERPGVERAPKTVSQGIIQSDVMTWDEMDALDAKRDAIGSSGKSSVRTW